MAQAIADVGLYEFRGQLKYSNSRYGCEVLLADRFFPSSKLFSKCGTVKDKLSLGERTYHCENGRLVMHRDLNAAAFMRINLVQLLQVT